MTEITNEIEFLTGIKYAGNEYVGIVVNTDNQILTFYDADQIGDLELKKEFLELGNIWWWESNRMLPIDVFLHHEMKTFYPFLNPFQSISFASSLHCLLFLLRQLSIQFKRKSLYHCFCNHQISCVIRMAAICHARP